MITEAQLIAQQALEIAELKATVADQNDRLEKIVLHCVCIGGPLNDNRLQYTKEQRLPFHHICQLAEG
jgi:hypothetical protein